MELPRGSGVLTGTGKVRWGEESYGMICSMDNAHLHEDILM
jgi:tRNA-binding EMAP/Myf-like protein